MTNYFSCSIVLLILLSSSCSSSQKVYNGKVKEIRFGSGGGFTGESTTYALLPTCEIQKVGKKISELEKNQCKVLFQNAIQWADYQYYKPSNMSQFLEIEIGDSVKRFSWAYGSNEIKSDIRNIHQVLMKSTITKYESKK